MGRRLEQTFFQRNIQMVNRHLKRCSTSLTIREMQVKTKMRYHLTPVRMVIIKKNTHNKCKGGCGEKETPVHLLVRMWIGTATVETSIMISQKAKNRTTIWSSNSTPGYTSKKNPTNWKRYMFPLPVFIAALLTIAKI